MMSFSLKPHIKRSFSLALIFQIGWVVAAVIALLAGVPVHVGLLVALLFVLWVPAALELITRTEFPIALKVHFYIFMTLSSVAGSAFGVYALIPHWDSLVHADSGILIAWLGLFAVQSVGESSKLRIPRWFVVSTALVTPLAFAAVWEICEFMSDTFLHTATQAGLQDTILDMASAGIGAIIAVMLMVWVKVPKSVLPRTVR
jgi:uncharacterized membrane protein YhdT